MERVVQLFKKHAAVTHFINDTKVIVYNRLTVSKGTVVSHCNLHFIL